MAVPAATPVITPVVLFIVAIAVLLDVHAPPLWVELKVVALPTQTVAVPLKVPAVGAAVTVTLRVAVYVLPQIMTVYVIVAVPAETPEIAPVELFIVATPVLFEDHVPPLTEELKVDVPFEQMVCVPLSVPAEVPQGRNAIIIPPIVLGFVLGVHVTPPLPVAPIADLVAQAAPTAGVLPTLLCPASYNSVNAVFPAKVKSPSAAKRSYKYLPNG